MNVDDAFLAGLAAVRAAGLGARGNDIPVLAAYRVFELAASPKQADPRFEEQGPQYAKLLILRAYAMGKP